MNLSEESHLKVLRTIESKPSMSQREIARELGISLGKANYCLKALLEKGWIKARNFKNSNKKMAYSYLLTPRGIENKARLTLAFLERKREEFESIRKEIELLSREAGNYPEDMEDAPGKDSGEPG